MAGSRYEVRVSGWMSERMRSAFCGMEVNAAPPQTIMFGELNGQFGLRDLLALCNAMGVQVVSVHRLPADAVPRPVTCSG